MRDAGVVGRMMTVAASEAASSRMSVIMPGHLLIALSRLSEDDDFVAGDGESGALRDEFAAFGIEPRKFRRRLRGLLSVCGRKEQPETVRCSESTNSALAVADMFSRGADGAPFPVYLLRAVLLCLADMDSQKPGADRREGDADTDEIPHEL